jgi:2-iminobutanoate/2-iminopropanoate deaminase
MLTVHTLNDRICAPSHNAAHGTEVPRNARILFCNGQVGARLDGTVPEDPREQIEVIFERIRIVLAESRMTFADVVKFTVYITDKSVLDDYFCIRGRIMGDHNPPAMLLLVKELPRLGGSMYLTGSSVISLLGSTSSSVLPVCDLFGRAHQLAEHLP